MVLNLVGTGENLRWIGAEFDAPADDGDRRLVVFDDQDTKVEQIKRIVRRTVRTQVDASRGTTAAGVGLSRIRQQSGGSGILIARDFRRLVGGDFTLFCRANS